MSKFLAASVHLRLGLYGGSLNFNSDQLSDASTSALKDLASWIKKRVDGFTQSQAIEATARATGFSSWHDFLQAVHALRQLHHQSPYKERDALTDRFVGVVPLLAVIEEDMPPIPALREALAGIATRLAAELTQPPDLLFNIMARRYKAQTWTELLQRRPENSPLPLYTFRWDDAGKTGHFAQSSACAALVDELDGYFQDITEFSEQEQHKRAESIRRLIAKRPDFLEAEFSLAYWLASSAKQDADVREVAAIYDSALAAARRIIPVGFRGQIPWGYVENRWYHRLLFAYMRLAANCSHYRRAIQMANRQLRLNKPDNMGVRFILPALLVANGDIDKATKASRRLLSDSGADALLVHGLCQLAANQRTTGLVFVLRALFSLPMLRPLLLDNNIPNYEKDHNWHRGVIPDPEITHWTAQVIFNERPDVEKALKTLFNRYDVKAAEQRLLEQYTVAYETEICTSERTERYATWEKSVEDTAQQLLRDSP